MELQREQGRGLIKSGKVWEGLEKSGKVIRLLKTRQTVGGVPSGLKELGHSLAAYGLPDFSNFSVKSSSDQVRMQRILEAAIRTFDPRLEDVTVTLVPVRDTE